VGKANCSCSINPKAHTVFHAPEATRGYKVLVEKFAGTDRSKVFDNRKLQESDIFLAILLRLGDYQASSQQGAECRISVSPLKTKRLLFTVTSKQGVRRPKIEPVQIECTASGFNPEHVNIQTGQPLVFNIKAPSRIKIEYKSTEHQKTQVSC